MGSFWPFRVLSVSLFFADCFSRPLRNERRKHITHVFLASLQEGVQNILQPFCGAIGTLYLFSRAYYQMD
jgi:hypothetical protein